jgi:hypothetical protein
VSVASVIRHVKGILRNIRVLRSVGCLAIQHFSKLFHKQNDFREKATKNKYVF